MNLIVRLYAMLTAVSSWVESMRVALLVRVYGISNDIKSPVPWRVREGLPDHNEWPMAKEGGAILLVGAAKVGPVRPVPAKLDKEIV